LVALKGVETGEWRFRSRQAALKGGDSPWFGRSGDTSGATLTLDVRGESVLKK